MNVHSKCCKISSPRVPGFQGVGSQFKAWVKRDDLEKKNYMFEGTCEQVLSSVYGKYTLSLSC